MPTVLILGATSDIGFAIARKFASEKYDVQLAARKVEPLRPMQSDIQIRYSVNCTIHEFDALDFTSHQRFYDAISPKPDVTIYVIGYMNDNEKVIGDWNESFRTIDNDHEEQVKRRVERAAKNTWTARIEQFWEIIGPEPHPGS